MSPSDLVGLKLLGHKPCVLKGHRWTTSGAVLSASILLASLSLLGCSSEATTTKLETQSSSRNSQDKGGQTGALIPINGGGQTGALIPEEEEPIWRLPPSGEIAGALELSASSEGQLRRDDSASAQGPADAGTRTGPDRDAGAVAPTEAGTRLKSVAPAPTEAGVALNPSASLPASLGVISSVSPAGACPDTFEFELQFNADISPYLAELELRARLDKGRQWRIMMPADFASQNAEGSSPRVLGVSVQRCAGTQGGPCRWPGVHELALEARLSGTHVLPPLQTEFSVECSPPPELNDATLEPEVVQTNAACHLAQGVAPAGATTWLLSLLLALGLARRSARRGR